MADWEVIVAEHGPAVWQAAYRLLGNHADAADCFQETFVSALQVARRERVRDWSGLLRRLVTARALDGLRRRLRRSVRREQIEDWMSVPAGNPGPEQRAHVGELAARLRQGLARLPRREAEVFCLCCLEGRTRKEVGRALGMTPNHVGVVLHRARSRLREILLPENNSSGGP